LAIRKKGRELNDEHNKQKKNNAKNSTQKEVVKQRETETDKVI